MRFVITVAALAFAACQQSRPEGLATVRLTDHVLVRDVARFGVNLGTWTSWGAEQLCSNIVKNPGFEGMVDRAIVIVRNPFAKGFDDSEAWLARPDHFWDGAEYEVLSGTNAGKSGRILASEAKSESGLPSFHTDRSIEGLHAGVAISVTRVSDSEEPADWWFTGNTGARYQPAAQIRPGSEGARSLRISATGTQPAEAVSYFDAIGDRAGKLLPLAGKWRLSFWSCLENGQATLQVSFRRDGSRNFLDERIPTSRKWQRTELVFAVADDGPPGIASLKFEVLGQPAGDLLLDDVDLRRVSDGDEPFRGEVRQVLSELRPAYLRDWQGQLGDTLKNRLAKPEARRTSRYRAGDSSQADYAYSLPEFLDLALEIKASPWIVVPTTFSESECAGMGAFLRSNPRYGAFQEIVVEFGNENWNSLFRPAGIADATAHAEAADRCFGSLQKSAGPLPVRATVNAQHANPQGVEQLAGATRTASIVAVAPYFLHSLPAGLPFREGESMLFAGDDGRMKSISASLRRNGKELAVYEVGPHTNEGNATDEERMNVTSGMASASALAVTMLDGLALGARRQCVYTLAGFDNRTADGKGFVRLWGIARDLGSTSRLRPTGLSLELMNRALAGDMFETTTDDPDVHAYAFLQSGRWSAVIASSSSSPRVVSIQFPSDATGPTFSLAVLSDSPGATNEDGAHVALVRTRAKVSEGAITLSLPAFGVTALVGPEEQKRTNKMAANQ